MTLDEDVYAGLIKWFSQVRPKEGMAFLAGNILADSNYQVTHLYMPSQRTTRKWFTYTEQDKMEATLWAGRQNATLLGLAHSHTIYSELNYYGTMLSIEDAVVQEQNHLVLMLVLCFFGDRLAMTVWKDKFPCPLDLYRRQGRKRVEVLDLVSVEK